MELNAIHLGDCYELIKRIPDKSIDLIVTDPPYEYESLNGRGIDGGKEFFDELTKAEIDKGFDLSILDECVRILKNINLYIWVSKGQFKKVLDYMVDKYRCKWDLIVWNKSNALPLCKNQYLHDCEYCLYFRGKGVKLNTKYETAKTVYVTPINQTDKRKYGHPTIKPEEIIENLIRNSCGGGVVLDPFAGSGTTCVVAKRLGFGFLGFEIAERYWKIAVDRINGFDQRGVMNLFDAIPDGGNR